MDPIYIGKLASWPKVIKQQGGGSTLQSKQRWCEIEAFTSRFIHSSAKLALSMAVRLACG
jgi:hypothetical protein